MSISEIHALLALMDDPDETVYDHVRERLLSKGKDVLPFVTDAANSGRECALFQSRLTRLQEGLQQSDVRAELDAWMACGGDDLWGGIQLVQRAVDPAWQVAESNYAFESLKKEVWLELNEELTALEQVRILNHIFFSVHEYEGVRRIPHVPAEALPTGVLAGKKGNPVGLGMLYLAVAQSLGIPMRGINLPNHFILAYCDDAFVGDGTPQKGQAGILFYINPYSQGTVIGPDEVSEFLSRIEGEGGESGRQWRPAHPMEIVQRLVRNVAYALREHGDQDRADRMLDVFKPLLSSFENAEERSGDYPNV
jgi:regulator of sirC expression with transglutaminase-like and TPR domain